jgi:type II secretory pathway pseudopilin PulG
VSAPNERGLSLVEMTLVLMVLGLIVGFSVPPFQRFSSTFKLQSAAENIAAQLRLAREKAIATGVAQPVRFDYDYLGLSDYRTTPASGVAGSWRLPRGVTYVWGTGTENAYVFQRDGRCDRSGLIVLKNEHGLRDTVSVQLSGLVVKY